MAWLCAQEGTLTVDRLRELVEYQPATGRFIRRVSTAPRALAGGIAGDMDSKGYWRVRVDKKRYLAHRLAWFYMTGVWPAFQVDHKNTIRTDNRWDNLRPATQVQNFQNMRVHKDNVSGLKGASWHKQNQKWRSRIWVDKKELLLGYFDTPEEAHEAYKTAAKTHFGEFARSN